MIRVSRTLWHFSTFIFKKCFLLSAGAAVFSNEGKGKLYSATSDWTQADQGELLACSSSVLWWKSSRVVTTYVFKDSLLETKMSYFHTSLCGCLTFTFFFFPNLIFMEALKFCQNMSALPISEWNGPMR